MSPEDPRHGTVAGHIAHQRDGGDYCIACIAAKARYDKRRQLAAISGHGYTVPSLGARRRVEALQALGYSRQRIAEEAGWTSSGALRYVTRSDTMTRATFDRIAAVYDRLCMRTPNTEGARRARTWAKRHGYAPPLAWDDIDDPSEQPNTGGLDVDADPVVIARILAGDASLAHSATTAERRAVVAEWTGSLAALDRLTGWRSDRYIEREDGAA